MIYFDYRGPDYAAEGFLRQVVVWVMLGVSAIALLPFTLLLLLFGVLARAPDRRAAAA